MQLLARDARDARRLAAAAALTVVDRYTDSIPYRLIVTGPWPLTKNHPPSVGLPEASEETACDADGARPISESLSDASASRTPCYSSSRISPQRPDSRHRIAESTRRAPSSPEYSQQPRADNDYPPRALRPAP